MLYTFASSPFRRKLPMFWHELLRKNILCKNYGFIIINFKTGKDIKRKQIRLVRNVEIYTSRILGHNNIFTTMSNSFDQPLYMVFVQAELLKEQILLSQLHILSIGQYVHRHKIENCFPFLPIFMFPNLRKTKMIIDMFSVRHCCRCTEQKDRDLLRSNGL